MGVGWSREGVQGVPLELVFRVLCHTSLRDLTTLLATCCHLRNLVLDTPLLWARVHTRELWPNEKTCRWFEWAARCGNAEAGIKLAVALLYNEGVSMGRPFRNGEEAFALFERLETAGNVGPRSPLWLLYRPPWGPNALCTKRFVFMRISHIAEQEGAAWAVRIMSRISEVVQDGASHSPALEANWGKQAQEAGDVHARVLAWQCRYERRQREGHLDPGIELQAIRELREMCLSGHYPAARTLALFLATSRCPQVQRLSEIREFLANSPVSRTFSAMRYQQSVTAGMRLVMVTWLVAVVNHRRLSSRVLHTATQILDSYLSLEQVSRNQLPLIGITSVLLATRYQPGECMMVSEVCQFANNLYGYGDVVRTIGHIMASLKANVALPTILDYTEVLLKYTGAPQLTQEWTRFVCDLSTSCAFPPNTTLAQIAASCVMLGFIFSHLPIPNLVPVVGSSHETLLQPLVIIYSNSLGSFREQGRQGALHALLEWYSDGHSVDRAGLQPVPSPDELREVLGLSSYEYDRMVDQHSYLTGEFYTEELPLDPDLPDSAGDGGAGGGDGGAGGGGGGGRSRDSDASGRQQGSEAPRGGGGSSSSSMEHSDSESGSESPDMEDSHLRTSESLSEARVPVEGARAAGAIVQCQQDQAGAVPPPSHHRHLQLLEQNVILKDVDRDSLSETTETENARLLTEAYESPGARLACVSLKRKLEQASESERSEKYLIRDVGNLQLG